MYRHLNKEARAPLPAVHKAIRQYERRAPSGISNAAFNRACISILHAHNWRKRDYLRELAKTAAQVRTLRRVIVARPRTP